MADKRKPQVGDKESMTRGTSKETSDKVRGDMQPADNSMSKEFNSQFDQYRKPGLMRGDDLTNAKPSSRGFASGGAVKVLGMGCAVRGKRGAKIT